jgi:hypothetical protein
MTLLRRKRPNPKGYSLPFTQNGMDGDRHTAAQCAMGQVFPSATVKCEHCDALKVKQHRGNNGSGSDKTADHDNSFDVGLGKNTSTQRAIGSHRLKRTDVTCVQNRLGRQPRISRH